MATAAWKLSCELIGHEQDVRSIKAMSNGSLATASRDKTVRIWNQISPKDFASDKVLIGHEHFVSCAIELPPCPAHPSGAVLSGGYDRTMNGQTIVEPVINIWEGDTIVGVLKGHMLTVTSLAISAAGMLISTSWDKTCRVWDLSSRACVQVLTGHEQAVWSCLALEDGGVLTAAADKTIKLWRDGKCANTYRGHTDAVRALALMPGIGFFSTGNDATIRLWSETGECLMEMKGHESFVYSLAVLPSGMVASSSEDKTCKVWQDGQCIATIPHAGSVWAVTALENGDIATACADSVGRVWTCDATRYAEDGVLAAYESMLASQTIAAQEVGGVKMDQLPGLEALEQPGAKDGATKIVRVDNKAYAYCWNSAESKWDQIGTVVDGPAGGGGGGGKSMLNGKEYDQVFDIEIDEGVVLKCGYNRGDNPYSVAFDFIQEHELPQDHLEEIAKFIERNIQNVTLGAAPAPTQGFDPLTGGHNAMYESAPQVPAGIPAQNTITFESTQHIPKKAMVFFEQPGKVDAVDKKIGEFNQALVTNANEQLAALGMNMEEGATFRNMLEAAFNKDAMARPPQECYALLASKLLKWPKDNLFPVLDVLRMLVLNPYAAKQFTGNAASFNVVQAVAEAAAGSSSEVPAPTKIMALRFFVNSFRNSDMRSLMGQSIAPALMCAQGSAGYTNAQVQLGYGSLLLDVAVYEKEVGTAAVGGDPVVQAAISGAADFLKSDAAGAGGNEDAIFRALCAAGTLLWEDQGRLAYGREVQIPAAAQKIADAHKGKIKEAANQLKGLF